MNILFLVTISFLSGLLSRPVVFFLIDMWQDWKWKRYMRSLKNSDRTWYGKQ